MTESRALTVLLTSVAYFMVTLDALVVVTALPSIHRGLGGGIGTLQWTVSAYTMAFGAGIITAAALGDRLGRRRVYVCGLVLFTLASAACALAPNAEFLIGCRAVQGLGASAIMPLGLTILTSSFPPGKARCRRRDLGRHRRAGRGLRAACRRGHHAGAQLALDLLGQRSDRHRGGRRGCRPAPREPRDNRGARHAGPGAGRRGRGPAHLGPDRRGPIRVGQHGQRGRAGGRLRPDGWGSCGGRCAPPIQ